VDCELLDDEECPAISSFAPLAPKFAYLGHQSRVPSVTSLGMSCATLAQVDARKAQLQCVIPPSCGRRTCSLPLVGVSLVHTTKACVLGGGTALSGMASELLELCEVVARASCGVVVVADRRSDGP
jgi:hypothetical protein